MTFTFSALNLLLLFLAGSFGALIRFAIMKLLTLYYDHKKAFPFPHHTFLANLLAGFLIGLLGSLLKYSSTFSNSFLETLLFTGILGALSTFSTFIADIFTHLREKKYFFALYYSFGTIFLTLIAGLLGRLIGGVFKW